MTTCKTCNSMGQIDAPAKAGATYAERVRCPDCNGTGNAEQAPKQVPGEFAPSDAAPATLTAQEIPDGETNEIPKGDGVGGGTISGQEPGEGVGSGTDSPESSPSSEAEHSN
jgi:hypothetical protein